MIELNDLEIGYTSKKVIKSVYKNINANFNSGMLIGLIGNNGVGKSTLLKTITGSLKPLAGKIFINKKNITDYTPSLFSQTISIVVTEKISGFNLTVWDVVALGRTPYISVFAKLSNHDERVINESLETLQIEHLKTKLIDELSDGQRQKVMIAKSLAQQTPIIIMDEPTAFLDYNSKHHLFKLLKELCVQQNKLIIVSSHDLDLMKKYVSTMLEMSETN